MSSTQNKKYPSFIYGTAWKKERTQQLVENAVNAGFRAIDTANQLKHYNEPLVGEALLTLSKQGIKREELFLQTKFTSIDSQDHRLPYDPKDSIANQVKQSFESSLNHLHTDYIDSYVLHGPYNHPGLGKEDWEAWGAIEELFTLKKTKAIGVSNVNINQLKLFCEKAKIKPMAVQNRCFAINGWDYEVREYCKANNICYQGFSLLTANPNVLSTPPVISAASRLNITPEQVILCFSKQIGMSPLTGTSQEKHMQEDLHALTLNLNSDELQSIERIEIDN